MVFIALVVLVILSWLAGMIPVLVYEIAGEIILAVVVLALTAVLLVAVLRDEVDAHGLVPQAKAGCNH